MAVSFGNRSPCPAAWPGMIHPGLVVLMMDAKSLFICTVDVVFLNYVHIAVLTETYNCL